MLLENKQQLNERLHIAALGHPAGLACALLMMPDVNTSSAARPFNLASWPVSKRKGSPLPLLPLPSFRCGACVLPLLLPSTGRGVDLPFFRPTLASYSPLASTSVYCSSSMLATLSLTLRRA